uniref:Uncharacterized protein n=1 Tax=Aegilops tauschii subsp. strangulata TaxID=200361 RepID=A0A453SR69_AEGTS
DSGCLVFLCSGRLSKASSGRGLEDHSRWRAGVGVLFSAEPSRACPHADALIFSLLLPSSTSLQLVTLHPSSRVYSSSQLLRRRGEATGEAQLTSSSHLPRLYKRARARLSPHLRHAE